MTVTARVLYTPEILSLATSLAEFPLGGDLPLSAHVKARPCGSTMTLGAKASSTGRIERLGARVSACAVGQASAAIFLNGATGRSLSELHAAADEISRWLNEGGPAPDWPDIAKLEPARAHAGRLGAILLPWQAGVSALSNPPRAD